MGLESKRATDHLFGARHLDDVHQAAHCAGTFDVVVLKVTLSMYSRR
ncbi:MAG TPA: hypothetical protein VH277_18310 [Gemmatimonadaceae bacterium]|jgi:hypothetical protein|nr:hypothetical protein [Gemmatimonadaceae bacterium]